MGLEQFPNHAMNRTTYNIFQIIESFKNTMYFPFSLFFSKS